MQHRAFGTLDTRIPIIGQGTWYLEDADDPVAALRRGVDLGMTHIDTAEMYGSGASEKCVGEAIAGRRDEVFLVSKVLPSNASRAGTIRACEASLRRLDTDVLDLYLLHWPGSYPLADTVAAFEMLLADGKIRAFGVSNFDVPDLEELAEVVDPARIACNQVLYNPMERTIEDAVLPWCRRHAIPVVAYSPFGHGELHAESDVGRTLTRIATTHEASAHQVALAFVTRHDDVFAIPKAARAAHLADNAAAGALRLSAAAIAELETVLPMPRPGARLPMI